MNKKETTTFAYIVDNCIVAFINIGFNIINKSVRINEIFVNTVTTKQDRNPNSGIITYRNGKRGKEKWRYLTPRECFMLMGFDEKDYSKAIEYNPYYNSKIRLLNNEKMIKMAGNSICVDVLEALFRQVLELKHLLN